ncbi:aldo/keto reductase [Falsochrobactrum sp. TDYN1]|uniref:Aldo/keto reductase n=1 Tax=Falsochrobactrum tianjinense TaxID=2706015 RepID=A0A949UT80_9HYPH|nr:aldo/keto reductase [Falsochrobactrum sp. TDYN1]
MYDLWRPQSRYARRGTRTGRCAPFIRQVIEAGINFFDTENALSAGASEEVIDQLLKEHASGEDVVITTKVYFPVGKGGLNRRARRANLSLLHWLRSHRYLYVCESVFRIIARQSICCDFFVSILTVLCRILRKKAFNNCHAQEIVEISSISQSRKSRSAALDSIFSWLQINL